MRFHRHALVVEDERSLWEPKLRKLFPEPDWKLDFVSSAQEAEAEFEKTTDWDLLIIDFKLQGEASGRTFLKRARQIDQNIPIVLFTQILEGGYEAYEARQARAIFFSKPDFMKNPEAERAKVLYEYHEYMAQQCRPEVYSEFDKLRTVLVHTPGDEIRRIDTYDNTESRYYLFDSTPRVELIQSQHVEFIKRLKQRAGRPVVLDIALLLYDVLKDLPKDELKGVVERILFAPEICLAFERFRNGGLEFSDRVSQKIDEICSRDAPAITQLLLCGLNVADFISSPSPTMWEKRRFQVVEPIPNSYFTRDPAFVLGRHLVLGKMFRNIRRREPAILREVLSRHPFLKYAREVTLDLGRDPGPVFSAEGGDAMAIEKGKYALAVSERTSLEAAHRVIQELFKDPDTECVYQPSIPRRVEFIHLDTVCSLAGPKYVVAHTEALAASTTVRWTRQAGKDEPRPESLAKSFVTVLEEELGREVVEVTDTPDQWDDATNVFMVDPSTAVAYARNTGPNQALRDRGIEVLEFSGDDLLLGRGGPRCMTMPLRRGS